MVVQTLMAGSVANLIVRRRRSGKKYSATLHFNSYEDEHHGLVLDLGVYVSKILPGSLSAKEGSIAVGDRIVSVSAVCKMFFGQSIKGYFSF